MSFVTEALVRIQASLSEPKHVGALLVLMAIWLIFLRFRSVAKRRGRLVTLGPSIHAVRKIDGIGQRDLDLTTAVLPQVYSPPVDALPSTQPASQTATAANISDPDDLSASRPVRFKMYIDWPNIAQDWLGRAEADNLEHQANMWRWLPGELKRILEQSPELARVPPGSTFQFSGAHVRASVISDKDLGRYANNPNRPAYVNVKRLLEDQIQNLIGYSVVITNSNVRFKDKDVEKSETGVVLTEEKEVDTGIAVQMVSDAANDLFDVALLLSDDRDQRPAILAAQAAPFSKIVIHVGSGRGNSLRAEAYSHIVLFDDIAVPPEKIIREIPAIATGPATVGIEQPPRPATIDTSLEVGSVHRGWVANDSYNWGVFVTLYRSTDDVFGSLENGNMHTPRANKGDTVWVEIVGEDVNQRPSFSMLTVDQKTGNKL